MKEPLIVDVFTEVVEKVSAKMLAYLKTINENYTGVRSDYGHPSEIVAKLASFSKTEEYRYKKYPLIGLFVDFPQTVGESVNVYASAKLNMFIAVGTDAKYTPQQRTETSFKPLIYPIRDEFLKQLGNHKNILKPEGNGFTYTQVDRYQWGKGGLEYYNNGMKNIFNDYIDACELLGVELQFTPSC